MAYQIGRNLWAEAEGQHEVRENTEITAQKYGLRWLAVNPY
ncbi:MAG: hypothetical protein OXK82_13220 [Deltaproteobacteria bacterium]|nr:hypothetical protein [Deltaproteobacteria bacterium]